jgi:hypothetical protein
LVQVFDFAGKEMRYLYPCGRSSRQTVIVTGGDGVAYRMRVCNDCFRAAVAGGAEVPQ